jgi:hypothetical protein
MSVYTAAVLLGLSMPFTSEDLKKAYKSAAMQYHPDKNASEDATNHFQDISAAYHYLKRSGACRDKSEVPPPPAPPAPPQGPRPPPEDPLPPPAPPAPPQGPPPQQSVAQRHEDAADYIYTNVYRLLANKDQWPSEEYEFYTELVNRAHEGIEWVSKKRIRQLLWSEPLQAQICEVRQQLLTPRTQPTPQARPPRQNTIPTTSDDNVSMVLFNATKQWSLENGIYTEDYMKCLDYTMATLMQHGINHVTKLEDASEIAFGNKDVHGLVQSYISSCDVPWLQVAIRAEWPRSLNERPALRRNYATDLMTLSSDDDLVEVLKDGYLNGLSWEDLGIVLYIAYNDLCRHDGSTVVNYKDLADRCFQAHAKGYPSPDCNTRLIILSNNPTTITLDYIAHQYQQSEKSYWADWAAEVDKVVDLAEGWDDNEDEVVGQAESWEDKGDKVVDQAEGLEYKEDKVIDQAEGWAEGWEDTEDKVVDQAVGWEWDEGRQCWVQPENVAEDGSFIGCEDTKDPQGNGWSCLHCVMDGRMGFEAPPVFSYNRWYCPCCGLGWWGQ